MGSNYMRPLTKEWLKAAKDDLMTTEKLLDNEHLTHIAAFHSQQCVEKVFKSILEEEEIDIPKIHKLKLLLNMLPKQQIEFDYDHDTLKLLDNLYIEARYPGDFGLLPNGKPTLNDAKNFHDFAVKIFEDICHLFGINKNEI